MEKKTLKSWIRGAEGDWKRPEAVSMAVSGSAGGGCLLRAPLQRAGRTQQFMGASLEPWFQGGITRDNKGQTWASSAPQSPERLACEYWEITGRLGLCETSHLPAQWALWQECISAQHSGSTAATNGMGLLMFVKHLSLGNLLYCQHSLVGKTTINSALFHSKTSIIPDLPPNLDKLSWKQIHTERSLFIRRCIATRELQKVILLANFENSKQPPQKRKVTTYKTKKTPELHPHFL